VIDIVVKDEAEAVSVAKRHLSYFQGSLGDWTCADQRLLRQAIPENRLRAYNIRCAIRTLADADSALELRAAFGIGIITALIRNEDKPFGVIANNPAHLGGAIRAALRRARPAHRFAHRHAGPHGRPRRRAAGACASRMPDVRQRRDRHRI
jgi:acetyl-CoA carboxylase carboxyltransferase component